MTAPDGGAGLFTPLLNPPVGEGWVGAKPLGVYG